MCELLALSSSHPARLTFSLHALAARGGSTGILHDGWGVAFYQGTDVALFREPAGAADSALVRFLESDGPATSLAISHIRHATQGGVSLANTQPFTRELAGRTHVFAHNGNLNGIFRNPLMALGRYRPVGQTDSEHAFCVLLERLSERWRQRSVPTVEERVSLIAEFAGELRAMGPANFLYSDGEMLFAHGDRRFQPANKRVDPPGLWIQLRHCASPEPASADCAGASIDGTVHSGVWVASVPIDDQDWRPFAEGEIVVVHMGEVLHSGFGSNGAHPPSESTST
jgi:glutamine amidotransferase